MRRTMTVYGLIDPRDNRVRYVGVTCSPRTRYSSHLSDMRIARPKRATTEWFAELRAARVVPRLCVLETVSFAKAAAAEQAWIDRHRQTLVNRGGGGQGMSRAASGRDTAIQVRLNSQDRRALERLAADDNRTVSDMLRVLLRKRLREAGVAL